MKRLFKTIIQVIRSLEGHTIAKLRLYCFKQLGMQAGEDVFIAPSIYIDFPENIVIGKHVSIQHGCYISAYGKLRIGNDVSIANGVSVITSTHPSDIAKIIRNQKLLSGEISIGNNVWIGMKSSIFYNACIGDNVIIGAHSLVIKDIEPNSIAFGTPCKKALMT